MTARSQWQSPFKDVDCEPPTRVRWNFDRIQYPIIEQSTTHETDMNVAASTTCAAITLLLTVGLGLHSACTYQTREPSDTPRDTLNGELGDELIDELDDSLLEVEQAEQRPHEWQERSFKGNSVYTITEQNNVELIRAETDGQASVLYRQAKVDLSETPVITWRWKVSRIYSGIDEKQRSGDDYPARLYVVIQTGLLPWETLAINYVWSSTGTLNDTWDNAFTDKAKMLALQAGDKLTGQWVQQRRNVVDDFKALFERDIDQLDGYAIMIDGDNSGQTGLSWFSDIRFIADPAR